MCRLFKVLLQNTLVVSQHWTACRCGGKLSNSIFPVATYIAATAWDFIKCKLALLSRDYDRCVSLCMFCVYKLSKVYAHLVYELSVSKSCVPNFAISRLHIKSNVKVGAGT